MFRPRLTALILLAALSARAEARTWDEIQKSGVLRVATSADFEPFNYTRNGVPTGFEVKIAQAVAKQLGLRIEWVIRPFDRLLVELSSTSAPVDVVIASHAINSTRLKQVDFAKPHYCTGGVILTRKGGPTTTQALAGQRLGAESGTTYYNFLSKLSFKKSVQVYPTSQAVIEAVATGRVRAIVTDRFAALEAIKTFPGAHLVLGDAMLWKEQIAMAVAKGNDPLRSELNRALSTVVRSGEYSTMSQSYFGQNIGC